MHWRIFSKIFPDLPWVPKKNYFFLFCSKCLGSKVTAVFVKIREIFFSVFCIFLAPNVKIRKIFFSKIFRSLLRASTDIATLVLTLFVFAQSCPKTRDGSKHWLLEVNPSHPHDHGFLVILATLELDQKPLIET